MEFFLDDGGDVPNLRLAAFSEDRLRQSSNVVASVNCLELPADGHFAWDVRWQGTKENFVLYRHDFSRAVNEL